MTLNRYIVNMEDNKRILKFDLYEREREMKKSLALVLVLVLTAALLLPACTAAAPAPAAEPSSAEAPAETAAPETEDVVVEETAATVVWPDPGIEGNLPETPSVKDDLAAYLNYDWYKNTEIPEGYSAWSSFSVLDETVRGQMIETLSSPDDSADQQKAAALYSAILDADSRDAAGLGSLQASFDALLAVESLDELDTLMTSDVNFFHFVPLAVTGVAPDLENSLVYVATVYAPYLSLNDSAEYTQLTEQGQRMKDANDVLSKALLTHNGISEADADKMIADAFAWETELAKGIYPTETSYRDDYLQLTYNEYSPEELRALIPNVPFMEMLSGVGLGAASRYIVSEPEALKTLSQIYTEENLAGVKAYAAIYMLKMTAEVCDSFSDSASIDWINAVYGSSGRKPEDVRAYTLCDSLFGELLGKIYAGKYFDEASKADVTAIIYDVFDAYKARLAAADWLSEATRATAVEKLDTMTLRVGYPEVYRFDWDKIGVAADKPLIDNYASIITEESAQLNALADQPVNRDVWGISANTVNACYEPSDNSINFPAAILNPPFYNAEGSRSENLGGIGSVIAHEITHAFDTTGSQFDKDGNMSNWWTDEDRAAFKALTDKVAERFASIEVVNGEHVRGDLTIGETVADLGAIACTLDIMRELDEPDYESFFGAWVSVWAQRITHEMREYYLKYDPHAPSYLRANVTLQQFQELYDTYDIQEGDFMYVAPEDRLKVW